MALRNFLKNLFRTPASVTSTPTEVRTEKQKPAASAPKSEKTHTTTTVAKSKSPAASALSGNESVAQLLQKHPLSTGSQRKAIEARLAQLLVADASNPAFFREQDHDLLQAFVLFAGSAELREQALTEVHDENRLAQIVRESAASRIRQLAAARIQDADLLNWAAEAIRQKDQGLYRQLRQRLDASQQAERLRQQGQQRVEKLCQDIEAHARASYNPLYAAKLRSLQQQWHEAADTVEDSLQQRFQRALTRAQAVAQEFAQREAEAQQADTQRRQALDLLAQVQHALNDSETEAELGELHSHLQQANQLWQQAAALQAGTTTEQSWQQQLRPLQAQIEWLQQLQGLRLQLTELANTLQANPGDSASLRTARELLRPLHLQRQRVLPVWLQSVNARLTAAEQHQARPVEPVRRETPKAKTHPHFEQLLTELAAAIQQGHTQQAATVLRQAQQYAREHRPDSSRLQQLAQEVHALQDWQQFAILPKKTELVARMAELAALQEADGPDQLEKIKALQAEWQALGMIHTDEERALWQRFRELGQQAYQPCERHFAQQRLLEEENTRQREALCNELQSYLDNLPAAVNWQRHVAILRTAREEWQRYHPVSNKTRKALQQRFNQLMKDLEDRLHQEYTQQAARKQALIDSMAALREQADIRQACDTAKQLQKQWKDTGSCGHSRDQKLWEIFRGHCDALFARRDEQYDARRQAEQQEQARISQILDDIAQQLASGDEAAIRAAFANAQDLRLPREQPELRQRLHSLREQWQQQRRQQLRAAHAGSMTELLQVLADPAKSAVTVSLHEIDALYDAESAPATPPPAWLELPLPQPFAQLLQQRWRNLQAGSVRPDAELFREQCLLLEMLLELPSPAEEQSLRVARQMSMFQQQSYPKTAEDRQRLVQQALQTLLTQWQATDNDSAALTRLQQVLNSDALLDQLAA